MNKKNQANNTISSSRTSVYALIVISSLFVVGSGVLASDVAAQNMTSGGNATGGEVTASTVNTTNATTSPEASMGISGVTELSEGNATITNQSGQ
jgi:hypothetical protein